MRERRPREDAAAALLRATQKMLQTVHLVPLELGGVDHSVNRLLVTTTRAESWKDLPPAQRMQEHEIYDPHYFELASRFCATVNALRARGVPYDLACSGGVKALSSASSFYTSC